MTVSNVYNISDQTIINTLKKVYNDKESVKLIFNIYKERQNYIYRIAIKFGNLITMHYDEISPIKVVDMAKKYQSKLGLTSFEFDPFIWLLINELFSFSISI